MNTDWHESKVSLLFDSYDDFVEEALGYKPLIAMLTDAIGLDAAVMDYGCGGGKVSGRLQAAGFSDITGFDISPTMVTRARDRVGGPVTFEHIVSARIPRPTSTFDGAVCCYVFINVPDRKELDAITTDIFRVLRPGGAFLILDTNPRSTGIKFANFRNGDLDTHYVDGATRSVYLDLPDGRIFEIVDTHWDHSTYRDVLRSAGFIDIESHEYTARDLPEDNTARLGANEFQHPPFVIFSGRKPGEATDPSAVA